MDLFKGWQRNGFEGYFKINKHTTQYKINITDCITGLYVIKRLRNCLNFLFSFLFARQGMNINRILQQPWPLSVRTLTDFCSFPTGKMDMILTYSIGINPLRGIFKQFLNSPAEMYQSGYFVYNSWWSIICDLKSIVI